MKRVELLKESDGYYLNYNNDKIKLNTKWIGDWRTPECFAVISGIKYLSRDSRSILLFEETFYPPNALAEFSYQLNEKTRKYDYITHKERIVEIAELLDDIEREYFIESIIKLASWGNKENHWVHVHLIFEKKVVPKLLKLLDKETNIQVVKKQTMRNLENTFVHDSSSLRIEKDVLKMQQIARNGGRIIQVCCSNTINILNKALEIELPNLEFNIFVESFHQHPLSGFAYNEYRVANKLEVNFNLLLPKIEKTSKLFKNPKLKNLFLNSIYDDAQVENEYDGWAPMLLSFNSQFDETFNVLSPNNLQIETSEASSHRIGKQFNQTNRLSIRGNLLIKSFPEFLIHEKREILAEKIKAEFNTEIGKNIRFLIESLRINDPPFISIGARQNKTLHKAMLAYFGRDIGSYQSIFNLKIEKLESDPDFLSIKTRIDFIKTKMII